MRENVSRQIVGKLWPHALWDSIKELGTALAKPTHARLIVGSALLSYTLPVVVVLAVSTFLLVKRWRRRPTGEPPMHPWLTVTSRLALEHTLTGIADDTLEVSGISVHNQQHRYENTCHDVRAEVVFTYAGGEVLKIHKERAQFLKVDGNRITGADNSVSLDLAEYAILGLVARRNSRFFAIRSWPADSGKPLRYGEWRVEIYITSDAEEDNDSKAFMLQLNPGGDSAWRLIEPHELGRSYHR